LPRTGPVRLLEVDRGLFMAVVDAPLKHYGEAAIARGLRDLDWVSRAAVTHEAVVESFIGAPAVLPFKLFTIFTSDQRALEHVRSQRAHIRRMIKRVANQQEWSVRVFFDPKRAERPAVRAASGRGTLSGAAYLAGKKARRDAVKERTQRARETVGALYGRLAAGAASATRRSASELPADGGPLLLDAAFLVGRERAKTFQSLAAREARNLARLGYGLTLSGPWPPYSFVQD
jgi:hypothetical protein